MPEKKTPGSIPQGIKEEIPGIIPEGIAEEMPERNLSKLMAKSLKEGIRDNL